MTRRFANGDHVFHITKNATGTVTGFIGGEEHRYTVRHSGYTWSVPEKYLNFVPSEIKTLQTSKSRKASGAAL